MCIRDRCNGESVGWISYASNRKLNFHKSKIKNMDFIDKRLIKTNALINKTIVKQVHAINYFSCDTMEEVTVTYVSKKT